MVTFARTVYRIAQFLMWDRKDQLILQPKFQRRSVWEYDARSYLIDTIVRKLPMPKIYLRKVVSPKTNLMAYEVVDGQQRLRAILDFVEGALVLSQRHNPELGDATFDTLPDPVQRAFLEYEISTDVMENASDPEVWGMFERLNSYTLTLNSQERLNAKWFGYFKQTAYKLAAEQSALDAWKNLRVFGDQQIARMKEVELTSDVLLGIVEGISDITAIPYAYEKYDRDFPGRERASSVFRESLAFITDEVPEGVRSSRFRNRSWFYSLMVAVADALTGIPKGQGPKQLRPGVELQGRMQAIDDALRTVELPPRLAELHDALSRATSHVPQRFVRHREFFDMLTMSENGWRLKWKRTTASD